MAINDTEFTPINHMDYTDPFDVHANYDQDDLEAYMNSQGTSQSITITDDLPF